MTVALFGGPLDGAVTQGLSNVPPLMVATNMPSRPMYRRAACDCCATKHDTLVYKFVGYEADESEVQGE